MPISLGTTTITALFLGTTSITSAYLGNTQVFGGSFSPLSLFSGGAQGVWYDPSDLTTMFQDAAGTLPVTAPGQLVGLRLDKSKGLVLGPELVVNGTFDSGTTGWTLDGTVTISGGVAVINSSSSSDRLQTAGTVLPAGKFARVEFDLVVISGGITILDTIGGNVAVFTTSGRKSLITFTTAALGIRFFRAASSGSFNGSIDNISVRELPGNHATAPTLAARPMYGVEPKGGRRNLLLATDTLATQSLTVTAVAHTLAFTGTGTVTLSGASTAGPLVGTGAGNRVSLTFTPTAASLTLTVSGSVTLGQLELGSSATAYQKVVTAENVTEAGVPTCHYCRYDGANNSMSTAAIDFTATDKMSVFAGVRKLSDAAVGMLLELSPVAFSNNGAFFITAGEVTGNGTRYGYASRGTAFTYPGTADTAFNAPTSDVLTGLSDIAGDRATLRIDGTQVAQSTADQGTGNFGNYPLFFGRRNNATLPFNGRDYGIIIVGKAASAGEITDTETWLAAKTSGVTI